MTSDDYRFTLGIALCMVSLAAVSLSATAGVVAGLVCLGVGVAIVARN